MVLLQVRLPFFALFLISFAKKDRFSRCVSHAVQ
jgi:hypothetical protein